MQDQIRATRTSGGNRSPQRAQTRMAVVLGCPRDLAIHPGATSSIKNTTPGIIQGVMLDIVFVSSLKGCKEGLQRPEPKATGDILASAGMLADGTHSLIRIGSSFSISPEQ